MPMQSTRVRIKQQIDCGRYLRCSRDIAHDYLVLSIPYGRTGIIALFINKEHYI